MKKMTRTIELHPDRSPEDNVSEFLCHAMKWYLWYAADAKEQAIKKGKPNKADWFNLVEKQQWYDVIRLAHRQGLIDAYNFSTGEMLLPNGKVISEPAYEIVFVPTA